MARKTTTASRQHFLEQALSELAVLIQDLSPQAGVEITYEQYEDEVVLVASGKQTPTTNQMIREQVGEDWYEYVPLGKFVVSAPDVCQGRPTFKYTRIEVLGVLERLGAGHAIEDLIADSQGRLTQEAIAEAARLAAKALTQLVPAQAGAA